MQTINVPSRNELKRMVKEETDKQMKFYLEELTKIRIKITDLESIMDVKFK